jgi:hypothetical protein
MNGPFPDGSRLLVFATDNLNLAKIFSVKTPHMLSVNGHGEPMLAAIINRVGWEAEFKNRTPAVYTFSSNGFQNTRRPDGTVTLEWTSANAATPIASEQMTKKAIMETGAQLFFVEHPHITKQVWHQWRKANFGSVTPSLDLYAALHRERLIEHENERLGIKPIVLEEHYKQGLYDTEIKNLKTMMACEELRQKLCLAGNKDTIKTPQGVLHGVVSKTGFIR